MKLSLPSKLVEKLVWVPVISFCKTFIIGYVFDMLLCRDWQFSPPNHVALWITLQCAGFRNPSGHSFELLGLPNLQYPI